MPQSITIPSDLENAKKALGQLGELITARKWERAAIVAAFVRLAPSRGQQHPEVASRGNRTFPISPVEFASYGIVGLLTDRSVTKYVQAWLDANDGKYPRPGSTRRLPNLDFPPTRGGTDGYSTEDGAAATITKIVRQHGGKVLQKALTELPEEWTEDAVAAAHEAHPVAAHRGSTRKLREDMEAMGQNTSGKLAQMPNEPKAFWMDADREIAMIHSCITSLHRLQALDPAMMGGERADRLERELELLRMLVQVCRGFTAADLDAALTEWAGE
jgi:hypothetical protein